MLNIALIIFILSVIVFMLRVLNEYERAVIFRLGRFHKVKGPGLIILIPVIDRMVKVSIQVVAMDVPPQDVITKDNVTMKVNAVIYFRVTDPRKAIIEVQDYLYATSQLAQTSLRSIIGESNLDEILSRRDEVNSKLQKVIDESTDSWGIKVSLVEVKHVDLPENMQRAMARQAEAERDRRAKIIASQGEFQAAENLDKAADTIGKNPVTIQLRYLQTLSEIAGENNSTTIFPIPMDLIKTLLENKNSNSTKK